MKEVLAKILQILRSKDVRNLQFINETQKYMVHLQKLYNSCVTLDQVYSLYLTSHYVKQLINQIRCLGKRNNIAFSVVEKRVDMLVYLEHYLFNLSLKRIKERQNND